MKTNQLASILRGLRALSVLELATLIAEDNVLRFHGDPAAGLKGNPHHVGPWSWTKLIHLHRDVLIAEAYFRTRAGGGKVTDGKLRLTAASKTEIVIQSEEQRELPLTPTVSV